jgi:YVTN family beta-propeller protein
MVYVSNGGSNSVSVISGSSNTVIANVPVGPQPYGVGVDLRSNVVYVANSVGTSNSSSISVIDGRTNTVTATIKAPAWAIDVGVNPRTELVYVAEYYICKSSSCSTDPNANSVLVISGASPNQED